VRSLVNAKNSVQVSAGCVASNRQGALTPKLRMEKRLRWQADHSNFVPRLNRQCTAMCGQISEEPKRNWMSASAGRQQILPLSLDLVDWSASCRGFLSIYSVHVPEDRQLYNFLDRSLENNTQSTKGAPLWDPGPGFCPVTPP